MSIPSRQNEHYLIDAYNNMMGRIRHSIESAEANAIPSLQKAINMARDQAVHLDEISHEQAEEIGNFIKRDINDAAEYLMETSHNFSDWLMLDMNIIEQKVVELFLSVADKTRLELEQLSHSTSGSHIYSAEEITGPGTLACLHCNKLIRFNQTDLIPNCPACQHNQFKRAEI